MIEILPQSTERCLLVHFSGKVTEAEYQQFLDVLIECLKTSEKVALVVEFAGFEFYGDFDAARMDLKFGFGDYKQVHRAAFVGDQKWIAWFTRFVGPFTRAEEKPFAAGQMAAAVGWACNA
jgi:hypothetical protein